MPSWIAVMGLHRLYVYFVSNRAMTESAPARFTSANRRAFSARSRGFPAATISAMRFQVICGSLPKRARFRFALGFLVVLSIAPSDFTSSRS